jgi:hypothetical protein
MVEKLGDSQRGSSLVMLDISDSIGGKNSDSIEVGRYA